MVINLKKNIELAEQLRYLILAAERQGGRMLQSALSKESITGSQAEVLRVLEERGPLSLKELGFLLICEGGSPSRLVNTLVQEGYIIRDTHPKDSRAVILRLSDKGVEKSKRVTLVEQELYTMISRKIDKDKLESINQILCELLSEEPIASSLQARGFMK
ncbi:winged helix DNA-binding protein [Mycolicibacterium fortuitum]|jgi:DNA-binding MarR family transcriptional regulator|nr:MarR family transcriptional regulator [Paenibacillus sp. FSL R5-808]MCA4754175.1 winged helix DNA-binding protein [Mycolicibacterium fortuitum]